MAKAKRKLKKEAFIAIIVMCAVLIVMIVLGIFRMNKGFVYRDNLDTIVITVNDTNISLKELTFYIMKVEETGQERALLYNEDNPLAYWNLYMQNENQDSGYMTNIAKQSAIDYCIRDNIYAKEAAKAGIEFTADEDEDLRYDAQTAFELMTNRQRMASELTSDDFYIILYKQQLSFKYMAYMAENDKDGTLESIMLKYDVGGTYYESLKMNYDIYINKDVLDNVKVGYVTVN